MAKSPNIQHIIQVEGKPKKGEEYTAACGKVFVNRGKRKKKLPLCAGCTEYLLMENKYMYNTIRNLAIEHDKKAAAHDAASDALTRLQIILSGQARTFDEAHEILHKQSNGRGEPLTIDNM